MSLLPSDLLSGRSWAAIFARQQKVVKLVTNSPATTLALSAAIDTASNRLAKLEEKFSKLES